MKQIPLTNSHRVALVDDEDYERVRRYNWNLHPQGYAQAWVGTRTVKLHQFLMGYRPGYTIDHENRDGLDCRRLNLRWATPTQQNANRAGWGVTSEYIGVCWHRASGKWQAKIRYKGRDVFREYFTVEEDAARARDRAAINLFGEFAKTNFPREDYTGQVGGQSL